MAMAPGFTDLIRVCATFAQAKILSRSNEFGCNFFSDNGSVKGNSCSISLIRVGGELIVVVRSANDTLPNVSLAEQTTTDLPSCGGNAANGRHVT